MFLQFRKQIFMAMAARILMIPIQIWSDPLWWQFVGDTFPEMLFASAWTTLVQFIVQLVGVAIGTGTNTTPGIVIQTTAYVVYVILIVTQVWNHVATVLLYALMCCIYAALLGTVSYYCPKLISLLRPTLDGRNKGVAVRIWLCAIMCVVVFLSHTIGYARLVISPPKNVYWWWKYGALELLPSVIFLIIMGPASNKTGRSDIPHATEEAMDDERKPIRRTVSGSSAHSASRGGRGGGQYQSLSSLAQETASINPKPPMSGYGATTTSAPTMSSSSPPPPPS